MAAGVADFLFHSLRRTFARNVRRMGISEGVIMQAGGWETRSIFERYDITDDSDLDEIAKAQDEAASRKHSESTQPAETPKEMIN